MSNQNTSLIIGVLVYHLNSLLRNKLPKEYNTISTILDPKSKFTITKGGYEFKIYVCSFGRKSELYGLIVSETSWVGPVMSKERIQFTSVLVVFSSVVNKSRAIESRVYHGIGISIQAELVTTAIAFRYNCRVLLVKGHLLPITN
ncbi:hypothetical protein PHYBLDRAFT_70510 [Phycomyces blakesleeanus NRRL 1555(-)]|uniref:Uncharacterized protein n=1 Tax=Phycomyces blakesleeanus (strain ATCC 8743b / DSM 1359 / FGSC 10004 / NBRC 33097 / NRRL 1555) TaxID=763407 RepID=A0A167L8M1_PHYB8|nr:hypothetical protein PHYBLDRAFT_70510 [Phycomyces blakesleeanus NRRL 1555(-)]OAD69838.1 hypothetical protein PHYBLDRAFT_70510 [Phycomyces blakesleeanus NRRL 1555(-)]|eukprot:XP_018287878.1 hypothetical protein PHYBLDRAFT_70510 [Phycomyces blakesleeanus NRRL 1555(-)]